MTDDRRQDLAVMEVVLPGGDVQVSAKFFEEELGFRLWTIYPADDPQVAILQYGDARVRLDASIPLTPTELKILGPSERKAVLAPNGTRVSFESLDPWPDRPTPAPILTYTPPPARAEDWIVGRAGMLYRDLIPSRWGGHCIASHIRIPDAGPVPDQVHFHRVTFQMIFCLHGWVRLVYQDQGEPFTMKAGDCVLQPPEIRHRVLEASAGLEVLEVSLPAEHPTHFDAKMSLPNGPPIRGREYNGQTFVLHKSEDVPDQEEVDIGFNAATKGAFAVFLHRMADGSNKTWQSTDRGKLLFGLMGEGQLITDSETAYSIAKNAAVALPPGISATVKAGSRLHILEVPL